MSITIRYTKPLASNSLYARSCACQYLTLLSHNNTEATLFPNYRPVSKQDPRDWQHEEGEEPEEGSRPRDAEGFVHWWGGEDGIRLEEEVGAWGEGGGMTYFEW